MITPNYSKDKTIIQILKTFGVMLLTVLVWEFGKGCGVQGNRLCVGRDTGSGGVTRKDVVNMDDSILPPGPLGVYEVYAYCPCERCCGKWADGITASGHEIQPGDKFAAAPPEFPFGAILDIPGYGKVPVRDRGGAIKGNRLDVFFPTHQAALEWGVKDLEIWAIQ